VAVVDIQLAFLDNTKVMPRNNAEYIYVRATVALVAAARSLGISVDFDALAPTLRHEGQPLIPSNEHLAVVRAIFEDRRETLGIDLAQALPLELAGLWSFLLRSSNTFGQMLRRAERYMRVVNRYSEFLLEERSDGVAMVCPHPDPSPYGAREQVVCALLGHWIAWGRQLTRASFSVEEARFQWPGPRDSTPFHRFFGGPVTFGADEDALLLRREVLDLPLPERTPEFVEQFEAYATALIRRMTPQSSLVERVREAIAEGLLTGSVKEAAVAQQLAMTMRTMHRRLVEAGTSFRNIRDELLRQRAQELLLERRVPIGEVSYLLGYAEPSNFHRAFRRWTGLTPAE
jgi:AraC-like DNA-binding protein